MSAVWVDDDPTLEMPIVVTGPDLSYPTRPSLRQEPELLPAPRGPLGPVLSELGHNLVGIVAAALGSISWLLKVLKPLVPIAVVLLLIALPVALVPWDRIASGLGKQDDGSVTVRVRIPEVRRTTTTTESLQYDYPGNGNGQRVSVVYPGLPED